MRFQLLPSNGLSETLTVGSALQRAATMLQHSMGGGSEDLASKVFKNLDFFERMLEVPDPHVHLLMP